MSKHKDGVLYIGDTVKIFGQSSVNDDKALGEVTALLHADMVEVRNLWVAGRSYQIVPRGRLKLMERGPMSADCAELSELRKEMQNVVELLELLAVDPLRSIDIEKCLERWGKFRRHETSMTPHARFLDNGWTRLWYGRTETFPNRFAASWPTGSGTYRTLNENVHGVDFSSLYFKPLS